MKRGIEVPKVGICTVRKSLGIRVQWIHAIGDYQDLGEFSKANYLRLILQALERNIREFVRRFPRLSPSERRDLRRSGFVGTGS